MANVRWFLMSPACLAAARADCSQRHREESGPQVDLSVTWNAAETQALVKVNGANKAWRNGRGWIGEIAGIFDRDDHWAAVALLQQPEWQIEE